jgi:hypothetical protein
MPVPQICFAIVETAEAAAANTARGFFSLFQ